MSADDLCWEDFPDWSTLVDRNGHRRIRLYRAGYYPKWTVREGFGLAPTVRTQIDPNLTLDEAKDLCRVLAGIQT